ncbi:hypothetical protein [Vibrio nigripulchritudo]|uniref:hypothetical protein n=1 Tax=Vibrio nigripulchritudo TaxID=28173 RepID=UPI0024904BD2|nr:hypothetical protein [Vibrio nigripulchritudo]BDU39724.1 lipoprotein [Vibrio nigripulchritudo]BDU45447.1 lipoprotein [Vibrio nigripulchritudo]
MIRFGLMVSVLVFLSGCVYQASERDGTSVHVVPVTYSIALNIEKNKRSGAQKKLDEFIKEHWGVIVNQSIELNWRTREGKKWAKKTKAYLQQHGVSPEQIEIIQTDAGFGERFDFELKTVVFKAQVETCQYEQVGSYSSSPSGCFSENARWQSMENPEKMLLSKPAKSIEGQ